VGLVSGINKVFLPADENTCQAVLLEAEKAGIHAKAGAIASGDQFVATASKKDFIIQNFGAIACEMEGAAVAQVCYANEVPFCVLRTISDSFSGKNEMDYAVFAEKAAHRGAEFLLSLLKNFKLF
jgi:adenosylhomocysteine nucleosidase